MPYVLSKADLKEKYTWSEYKAGDPLVTGIPDYVTLERSEGHEVLKFIQHFLDTYEWDEETVTANGQKIEQLLQKCPSSCQNHSNIKTWILDHWEAIEDIKT